MYFTDKYPHCDGGGILYTGSDPGRQYLMFLYISFFFGLFGIVFTTKQVYSLGIILLLLHDYVLDWS